MADAPPKRARTASGAGAGAGGVHRHAPAPPQADAQALQAFHHSVYFESYAHLAVHQEMLRDETRTLAYKQALEACAEECIRGKVVLDVGCGTGVLSSACTLRAACLCALQAARCVRARSPSEDPGGG
jgi:protein arginine N-methyltransferase 6